MHIGGNRRLRNETSVGGDLVRIYLSAGEHSGDMHAANLARAIRAKEPTVELYGMGGPLMRAAGVNLLLDPTAKSTIGFVEVLRNLGRFRKMLKTVVAWLAEHRPAAVVWVDFGGFNLVLAKECRRLGIPVVCVFSPSAWAYGRKRALLMAERVTELAAVLPFEAEFYRSFGLKTTFVGHPLLDIAHPRISPSMLRKEMGFMGEERILALLPGSRRQEIERLLPIMLEAVAPLVADEPRLRLVLPRASSIPRQLMEEIIQGSKLEVLITEGRSYDVLGACTAAIVASGTATLEAAIIGTPLVSIYAISPLSFLVYRALRNPADRGKPVSSALPNLVLGREVVPELLQDQLSAAALTRVTRRILDDDGYRQAMTEGLSAVRRALGEPGAIQRAAEIVLHAADRG